MLTKWKITLIRNWCFVHTRFAYLCRGNKWNAIKRSLSSIAKGGASTWDHETQKKEEEKKRERSCHYSTTIQKQQLKSGGSTRPVTLDLSLPGTHSFQVHSQSWESLALAQDKHLSIGASAPSFHDLPPVNNLNVFDRLLIPGTCRQLAPEPWPWKTIRSPILVTSFPAFNYGGKKLMVLMRMMGSRDEDHLWRWRFE